MCNTSNLPLKTLTTDIRETDELKFLPYKGSSVPYKQKFLAITEFDYYLCTIKQKNVRIMKLAEALSLRKDLETRISKIKDRLENIVRIQEGDKPAEEPQELMDELDRCLGQLELLIFNINVTNMGIVTDDGRSMTKLLAQRDILKKRIDVLRNTFNEATNSGSLYSYEIRYVTTIEVKPLRRELDKYSQEYRQLDMKIQELNFTNDLVE